ncbi:MAG: M20/M25/M40 family metallo-hydrolase [Thaumarchaeota archaeon]|nr:M20/M25/M40 family metallo-hydrolase [Nitrososphaerota archaeon]
MDQDVKAIIEKNFDKKEIKDTVIKIAQTPAPQTELYEREPLVLDAVLNLYRPMFEEAGCDTWIDDYGNLIATQGEGTSGKSVILLGFAMHWTVGTMKNPWSGAVLDGAKFGVEGEVVWGRGGSEYTGSNTAIINCARIVHKSGIRIRGQIIYIISSAGHTSSSDPVYHLLLNDQLKGDLCIMPGRPIINLGNTGRLDLKVLVYGKSVHSGGELSSGINAIEGGLIAVDRLKKIMPFPPSGKKDPDMGQGRLSIIGLASYPPSPGFNKGLGSGGHTLQNLMRILLDRRLVPDEDVQAAIDEIKHAIGDLSPWRVTYERGAFQLPVKHSKDSKIIRTVSEAYSKMLEQEVKYTYVNETIDAGYMTQAGIPAVMYGTFDMRFAHGDTDICQLNHVYDVSKVYAYWAIENTR